MLPPWSLPYICCPIIMLTCTLLPCVNICTCMFINIEIYVYCLCAQLYGYKHLNRGLPLCPLQTVFHSAEILQIVCIATYRYVKLQTSPAAKYGVVHYLDTMPNPKDLIGIIQVLLWLITQISKRNTNRQLSCGSWKDIYNKLRGDANRDFHKNIRTQTWEEGSDLVVYPLGLQILVKGMLFLTLFSALNLSF